MNREVKITPASFIQINKVMYILASLYHTESRNVKSGTGLKGSLLLRLYGWMSPTLSKWNLLHRGRHLMAELDSENVFVAFLQKIYKCGLVKGVRVGFW